MAKKARGAEAPPSGAAQNGTAQREEQQGGPERPAHEVKVGKLRATLWANRNDKGKVWYSISLSRLYRDQAGNWKTAGSFSFQDLLPLIEILRMAFWWIVRSGGPQSEVASESSPHGDAYEGEGDQHLNGSHQ